MSFLLPNDHHIRFSMMMIMKQDHGYHLPLGRKMENFFRKKERMLAVYTRVCVCGRISIIRKKRRITIINGFKKNNKRQDNENTMMIDINIIIIEKERITKRQDNANDDEMNRLNN